MTTDSDPWGITSGYEDTERRWHPTEPSTRQAILRAMGAEGAKAGPSEADTVRVVESGAAAAAWLESGRLELEDGAALRVDGFLPPDLPWGYHRFYPDDSGPSVRVIAAPEQCRTPERTWGWAAQLYAVRSHESWGIGDFADLRLLADWSARLHAGILLVNPLGAAAPVLPQVDSPYYPSSRRFLNPLYLRVEEVPGAERLGEELGRLASAGRALNDNRLIDRNEVFRLKDRALRAIHQSNTALPPDFDRYCQRRGAETEGFASYCALACRFGGDWREWPSQYRMPASPAVAQFVLGHAREIGYHKWLQWLLEGQLARAAAGPVALVQDLPIGVAPGGADAWLWQDLLARQCSVGAPPDSFNASGQDWAMPPFVPHLLRGAEYEPFIQTIRGTLRHAGGLRIDHVMGLFRLYWIPDGLSPRQGAYVRYPARDLLAIVVLESRRHGAFVVGEDLGTVEEAVRRQLQRRRMLSFPVLWFEKRPPAEYPEFAMAAVTTHDLPTLTGVWTGKDEKAQRAIGLDPGASLDSLRRRLARLTSASEETPANDVILSAYRLLSAAPSRILSATLEDARSVPERPNMPGTIDSWPNWRLALPGGVESLRSSDLARKIARVLTRNDEI